MIIEIN